MKQYIIIDDKIMINKYFVLLKKFKLKKNTIKLKNKIIKPVKLLLDIKNFLFFNDEYIK